MAVKNLDTFFTAAREGNIKQLKYYLNTGVDIHSNDDLALRLAIENKKIDNIISIKYKIETEDNILNIITIEYV